VTGSHRFVEEGGFQTLILLTNGSGQSAMATVAVNVSDPPVSATGGFNLSGTAGLPLGAPTLATFTDPAGAESLSNYSAQISWGDGTSSSGLISNDAGSGVFTVQGDHTYPASSPQGPGSPTMLPIQVTISHESWGTVTVNDSVTISQPALSAWGQVAVALEDQSFTATVASFTGASSSASDYSATIRWGDSQVSAGLIQANGNGGFDVIGTHSYGEESPYAVAVEIRDSTGDVVVAGAFVDVFSPDQDGQFQVIQGASVQGSGGLSQTFMNINGNDFVDATGSLTYTLETAGRNGLYESFARIETGTLTVKLQEAGQLTPFTLDSSNLQDQGTSSSVNQVAGSDLSGFYNRTENASTTFALTKNGDDTTGIYHWQGQGSITTAMNEDGVYPLQAYHRTDSVLDKVALTGLAQFLAQTYAETQTESIQTVRGETGHRGPDNYRLEATSSDNLANAENGNLATGEDDVNQTDVSASQSTEQDTNAAGAATITANAAGNSDLEAVDQEGTGDLTYTLSVSNRASSQDNGNQKTDVFLDRQTDSTSFVDVFAGNKGTGAYSLTDTAGDSLAGTSADTNQTAQDTGTTSDSATSSYTQTGNTVSGDYIHSKTGKDTGGTTDHLTDLTETDDTADGTTSTYSQLQIGNTLTGDYTLTQAGSDTITVNDNMTDQTENDVSAATQNGTSTLKQTGNTFTGDYSNTIGTSNAATDDSTTTDLTDTLTNHQGDNGNASSATTGNTITGAYTTVVSATSTTTDRSTNTD
jgi:hypothetical protein